MSFFALPSDSDKDERRRDVQRDWEKIRAEYVTGNESYEQLAARHDMHKSQLGKKAKEENWPAQRATYRKSVADATMRKKRYKDSEKLAGLMDAADKLIGHVQRLMDDEDQFRRRVDSGWVKVTDGVVEHRKQEFLTKKVDTKELVNAARALNEATRAVRDLYNIPTQAERDRKALEEKRLRLLEDKRGDVASSETGVALMAPVLEETDDGVEVE